MDDRLSKEEQDLFDSLSKEKTPPVILEEKVVNQLKEKQLIMKHLGNKDVKKKSWAVGIAAAITFFLLGFLLGNMNAGESNEISSGYILLLHEDEGFQPEGSEMEVFTEYATWMGKMFMEGVKITGNELSPESTSWLRPADFSISEVRKDKISGYFIIDVEDRAEAERIARSSPHIKYGGTVELIKLSERN